LKRLFPIRLQRDQRGATMIESALAIFIIVSVIFWTFELCMLVYTYTVLADAANEGVRYAIVHSGDTTNTINRVREYAAYSLHDVSAMTVDVTYPDGPSTPPNRVQVRLAYNFLPFVSIFTNPPQIRTFAVGRLVY
jgi:Flp pilus assembly protein TadG